MAFDLHEDEVSPCKNCIALVSFPECGKDCDDLKAFQKIPTMPETLKTRLCTCKHCRSIKESGRTLPLSAFGKLSSGPDGIDFYCLEGRRVVSNARYRDQHPKKTAPEPVQDISGAINKHIVIIRYISA